MATQIQCPSCGQAYDLQPQQVSQYAGQTITCTTCQKPFTVPANLAGAAPPMPVQPPGPVPGAPGAGVAYAQGGYYNAPARTSGLAIASLVLAIIGLLVPGLGLVGLVLGIIALVKMRSPEVGGKGLAIAGICVGAASILFAGCMLSVLLPSLNRARETANRVKCASNMRQIGQGLLLYANENKGQYPPTLAQVLETQPVTPDVFICPDSNDTPAAGPTPKAQAAQLLTGGHCSYVYVPGFTSSASQNAVILYEPLTQHGNDGCNFLYGDGHVSWESRPTAQSMINQVKAGTNPPK